MAIRIQSQVRIGPSLYDVDALAFITATGITDITQKNAINQLVLDLKSYSIWSKMKAIYPFVGGTATTHKFNLKNPLDTDAAFRLVFNGGITHNANGITPNGTNGYANTFFAPSSNLSINDSCHGAYVRTAGVGGFGLWSGESSRFDILPNFSLLRYSAIGNNGQVNNLDISLGLIVGSRKANNINKIYTNGVLKATNTTTNTATTFGSTYPYSIGNLGAGSNVFFDNSNYAFNFISDGLNDSEVTNLYVLVQQFQTALSRNV